MADIFCKSCSQLVCTRCFLSEGHVGHSVVPVEDALKNAELQLAQQLSTAEAQYARLEAAVRSGQQCGSQLVEAVESAFRALGVALLARKEQLLLKVRVAMKNC